MATQHVRDTQESEVSLHPRGCAPGQGTTVRYGLTVRSSPGSLSLLLRARTPASLLRGSPGPPHDPYRGAETDLAGASPEPPPPRPRERRRVDPDSVLDGLGHHPGRPARPAAATAWGQRSGGTGRRRRRSFQRLLRLRHDERWQRHLRERRQPRERRRRGRRKPVLQCPER